MVSDNAPWIVNATVIAATVNPTVNTAGQTMDRIIAMNLIVFPFCLVVFFQRVFVTGHEAQC
jgi:hypothetical protein